MKRTPSGLAPPAKKANKFFGFGPPRGAGAEDAPKTPPEKETQRKGGGRDPNTNTRGGLHLRKLFRRRSQTRRAHDRRSGGAFSGLLEEPHHRRNRSSCCFNWRRNPACGRRSTPCSAARKSTSRKTAPCCTSPCARPKERPFIVDGKNVVPEVHAVLDKMADFSNASAAARGKATPANAFATSSTSASAAPTSAR